MSDLGRAREIIDAVVNGGEQSWNRRGRSDRQGQYHLEAFEWSTTESGRGSCSVGCTSSWPPPDLIFCIADSSMRSTADRIIAGDRK